jgi:hypothetical protein
MKQHRTHPLGTKESWTPSNDRPRSRAIRIKRTSQQASKSNVDDLDDIPGSSNIMYDWATWRMYNRIVDHRDKYPIKASQETVPGDVDVEQRAHVASSQWDHSSFNGNLIADEAIYPALFRHSDHLLDEEVFELEL